MKYSAIFSHASRLRESGNRFILAELEKVGLSDIAPSHGDILVRLLACEACKAGTPDQVHRDGAGGKTGAERLCAAHTGSGGFPRGAGTPDGQGARTGTGF